MELSPKKAAGMAANPGLFITFAIFLASSTMMVLLNKYVATGCKDHMAIIFVQAFATVALNIFGTSTGILPPMKPFTGSQVVTFLVPSLLFSAMLCTSLTALPHVAIGTVIVFRAISSVIVAIADRLVFGTEGRGNVPLLAVIGGAALYGMNDITYDPFGYFFLTLNAVMFTMNHIYEKYAISNMDQTPEGISIIQNGLTMPIMVLFSVVRNESPMESFSQLSVPISIAFVGTCVGGFFLSIAYVRLNKTAEVTSIALTSWFAKLLSLLLGPILFSYGMAPLQFLGVLISMAGVIEYQLSLFSKAWTFAGSQPQMRNLVLLVVAMSIVLVTVSGSMGLELPFSRGQASKNLRI